MTVKELIILLCGGDKSTQQADIKKAKKLALELEEEESGKGYCVSLKGNRQRRPFKRHGTNSQRLEP